MEQNDFDDIIKQKLAHPAESEDRRAWDLFMLSAIEKGEEDIFEDRSTDLAIKTVLKDYKVDFNAASWAALEKKMDAQPVEEPILVNSRFDKEVSNSLQGLKRKYDSSSWPKLAARLEAEERYLRHYYRAKFVEAVLFIFLVLTLFQFGQFGKIKLINKEQLPGIQAVPSDNRSGGSANDKPIAQVEYEGSGPSASSTKASYSTSKHLYQTSADLTQVELPSNLLLTDANMVIDRVISDPEKELDRASFEFAAIPQRSYRRSNQLQINPLANSKLYKPTLAVTSIASKLGTLVLHTGLSLPKISKAAILGTWRIGMYAHMDVNEIKFPEQTVSLNGTKTPYSEKNVKSLGYGSGFKALYTKNRIGFEAGLGYAYKSYAPNRVVSLDQYINVKFVNIDYQIVEMPVSIRYGSKNNNRFKTYAQAGLSTNFITNAIYDVVADPKLATIGKNGLVLTPTQDYIISRVKDQFTKFDKRRVLLYGQGAVGAEWKASMNVDIYSQLAYSQRILKSKLGPNYDQFKSLSLELGIRTKL